MSDKKPKTPKLITGEDKLKELIKRLIRQELDEMTGTGAVAPVTGPFAFSQRGQRHGKKATDAMKGLGFSVAKEIDEEKKKSKKLDPVGHEDSDVNNDGKSDGTDQYLLKRRLAVAKQQKRKKVIQHLEKELDKLDEATSRYNRLKTFPKKNSYKISLLTQEITKMLREVDFLMSMNEKLKTEMGVSKDDLWKRTSHRISEIKARLKSIGTKLRSIE